MSLRNALLSVVFAAGAGCASFGQDSIDTKAALFGNGPPPYSSPHTANPVTVLEGGSAKIKSLHSIVRHNGLTPFYGWDFSQDEGDDFYFHTPHLDVERKYAEALRDSAPNISHLEEELRKIYPKFDFDYLRNNPDALRRWTLGLQMITPFPWRDDLDVVRNFRKEYPESGSHFGVLFLGGGFGALVYDVSPYVLDKDFERYFSLIHRREDDVYYDSRFNDVNIRRTRAELAKEISKATEGRISVKVWDFCCFLYKH